MQTTLTHKIRLFPDREQEKFLKDCAFVARTAYNFGLSLTNEQCVEQYAAWEALPEGERPEKPKLVRDWAAASRAWTQAKKTTDHDAHPGVLLASKVPATLGFEPFSGSLKRAFKAYFNGIKREGFEICERKARGKKCWCVGFPIPQGKGHPKFKSFRDQLSFYLQGEDRKGNNCSFDIVERRFSFAKQEIKTAVELRFNGRPTQARVFLEPGEGWFTAISVEMTLPDPVPADGEPVGVDLGVSATATLSNGRMIASTRESRKVEEKRARLLQVYEQKKEWVPCPVCEGAKKNAEGKDCGRCSGAGLVADDRTVACPVCNGAGSLEGKRCRKCRGYGKVRSKRVLEVLQKIVELDRAVRNRRNHAMHLETTRISREHPVVVVEDVDLRRLRQERAEEGRQNSEGKRSRGLQKSFADAAPGEFRRQLEYKVPLRGGRCVRVPAAYTSRTCSECGHVSEKKGLSVREWVCPECWALHERDVNAARVILQRGLKSLAESGPLDAQ